MLQHVLSFLSADLSAFILIHTLISSVLFILHIFIPRSIHVLSFLSTELSSFILIILHIIIPWSINVLTFLSSKLSYSIFCSLYPPYFFSQVYTCSSFPIFQTLTHFILNIFVLRSIYDQCSYWTFLS